MEAFGRYELRRRLGIGGMAEVYEAVAIAEHGVEKPLVIKRILEEHSTNPSFREMFVDEARVAMRLSHANVVQVFDFGKAEDRYFLAMEHVFGKDLGAVLAAARQKKQPLPLEFTLFVVGEVAKGLDYAHRATGPDGRALGIVHRDVSPSNVMLSFDGTVKIGDFGIARFENRRGRTMASAIRGKVRYMSPEQVEGVAIDGRSDLFALGSVFFEMLTGQPAFDGKTDQEVLAAVRRATYRRPSEIQVVSVGVEPVLARMLAKDPSARYARGNDVHRDVEALASKLRLRSNSSVAKDVLLALFPRSERSADPNTLTLAGKQSKGGRAKVSLDYESETTQIRRLADINGLPEFVEDKPEEKKSPPREPDTADAPAASGEKGTLIASRYRLEEELGHGALGTVYRAIDTTIDEPIAIKLMAATPTGAGDIDRFKREILTARRITHPNVLRIFDFGIAGRESYISMELLSGGSLGDLVSNGPIPIARAVQIVRGVCEGLEAAHSAGIIHRDLKPDNILFDGEGRPKIVDFGLARLAASNVRTIGFSGTPYYMSPESGYGDEITPQSDIYSLGVVFYEMFTGSLPFKADGLLQIAKLHAEARPPDPTSLRRDLPPAIGAVLLRMLEKDPTQRDRSALSVAADIEAAINAPAPITGSRLAARVASRAAVTASYDAPTQVGRGPKDEAGPIPSMSGSEPTSAAEEPARPKPLVVESEERTSARTRWPPVEPAFEQPFEPAASRRPIAWAAVLVAALVVAGGAGFWMVKGGGLQQAEGTPAQTPQNLAVSVATVTAQVGAATPTRTPITPVLAAIQTPLQTPQPAPGLTHTPKQRSTQAAVVVRPTPAATATPTPAPKAAAQTPRVTEAEMVPKTVIIGIRLNGAGRMYMDNSPLIDPSLGLPLTNHQIRSGLHVFHFENSKKVIECQVTVRKDLDLQVDFAGGVVNGFDQDQLCRVKANSRPAPLQP